ncbi:hypothetical protein [Iodidimonas sp. SYSU 1G8]|uniref:hypothetical protein n=1 Tax=Iodidimonas sp. SYSU 1G8 TaxID=3133967 RepID=UPI0031FEDE61
MGKLVLIGLVEPKTQDHVQAFKDWYLDNHVEDTFNCPNVTAVRCFKALKGFLGEPPAGYITVYEFEGDDAVAAQKILDAYQADPKGWDKRQPNNQSMKIIGAGWYEEEVVFG